MILLTALKKSKKNAENYFGQNVLWTRGAKYIVAFKKSEQLA